MFQIGRYTGKVGLVSWFHINAHIKKGYQRKAFVHVVLRNKLLEPIPLIGPFHKSAHKGKKTSASRVPGDPSSHQSQGGGDEGGGGFQKPLQDGSLCGYNLTEDVVEPLSPSDHHKNTHS